MDHLLALDLGLRCGMALYDENARLCWVRTQRFSDMSALKRAVAPTLRDIEGLRGLIVEGDGHLARVWGRYAEKRGASLTMVSPEQWRGLLLHPRDKRTGKQAKDSAEQLARLVIEEQSERRPTSLRTDGAEAVLIGLFGVIAWGWGRPISGRVLDALPDAARKEARGVS